MLFLIVGEADLFCVIGMVALTALAEVLTIPIAILAMRLAERVMKLKIENFRQSDIRTFR